MRKIRYVGFLDRILNLNIDGLLLSLIYFALFIITQYLFDGTDLVKLIMGYLPIHFIFFTGFLYFKKATPTMMFYHQQLVSEKTMERATPLQLTIRYIVNYVSFFAFGLGYFWMLIDKKNRTWHEIASGTIMIQPWADAPEDLTFAKKIVAKAHGVPVTYLKSKDAPINPVQK